MNIRFSNIAPLWVFAPCLCTSILLVGCGVASDRVSKSPSEGSGIQASLLQVDFGDKYNTALYRIDNFSADVIYISDLLEPRKQNGAVLFPIEKGMYGSKTGSSYKYGEIIRVPPGYGYQINIPIHISEPWALDKIQFGYAADKSTILNADKDRYYFTNDVYVPVYRGRKWTIIYVV